MYSPIKKLTVASLCALVLPQTPIFTTAPGALDYRFYGDYFGSFPDEAIDGNEIDALFTAGVYPDDYTVIDTHSAEPDLTTDEGGLTSGYIEWPQNGLRDDALDGTPTGDSGSNNYGGAISGILYPPATGSYQFFVRSDDGSSLFLNEEGAAVGESPTFLDPSTATPIVSQNGCCADFGSSMSSPIDLEAGMGYALEFIWKEGTGGDYMQLAWSLDGGPLQLISSFSVQRDVRYGESSADGITGGTTPGFEPFAQEGRPYPGVGVEFDSSSVAEIQWEIDRGSGFEPIEADDGFLGINSPFLSAPVSKLEWDGLEVRAMVDGEASDPVLLDIEEDDESPNVVSVGGFGTYEGGGILVAFDEVVDEGTATDPGNYAIPGQTVSSVRKLSGTEYLLDIGIFAAEAMELTISGVTDIAESKNEIDEDTFDISFSPADFQVLIFEDLTPRIGGGTLDNLVANIERLQQDPRFPSSPSQIGALVNDDFNVVDSATLLGGADLSDFGGFAYGRIIVEQAGDYQFAIRSDDNSAFYLSSDASSANLPPIDQPTIWEPSCCEALGAGAPDSVETITLAPGEYAFEAYYFEFGGGDYLEIGWRTSDNDPWTHIPVDNLTQDVVAGELSFTRQPQDTQALELRGYSLEAEVSGSDRFNIGYQWFKNDAPIPGATGPQYEVAEADLTDDGAVYHVIAFNLNGVAEPVVSSNVTLTVNADTEAPEVVNAIATSSAGFNRVTLTWSEPLDDTSAIDVANYSVTGPGGDVSVMSAQLSDDSVVTLETGNFSAGDQLAITAVGILDPSTSGNPSDESVSISASGTSIFQNGLNDYEGTADTQVRGATPDRNDGSLTELNPDGDDGGAAVRILIRFDDMFGDAPGQIPTDAFVQSATLYLDTTNPGSDQELHQMLQPWDEDEVVWNDFGPEGPLADGIIARTQADVVFATPAELLAIEIPSSTIQDWLSGATENYGWLTIPTGTNGQDFFSSEADDATRRPKLEVVWNFDPPDVEPDNTAPEIISINALTQPGSSTIELTWSEPVDDATAEDASKYAITGPNGPISVTSAVLVGDQLIVRLTTETFAPGDRLTVEAVGVLDRSVEANASSDTIATNASAISVFQNGVDGYEGTADTQIRGSTPDTNDGDLTELNPDGEDGGFPNYVLIRFDDLFGDSSGQIPSGGVIESVTLYLDTTNPGSDQDLNQILVPWDENEVVWNDFGTDGLVADGVNARLQADVRFAAPTGVLAIDIPTSTLQSWLDGESENYGWVTQPTGTDGQDFLSSENDEVERRPKLEVVWTLGGGSSEVGISISSDAGQVVLEYEGGDLYQGSSVTGPFTPVDGASSPYQIPISDAAAFFIVR